MKNSNWPEIRQAIPRVLAFFAVCFLIALLGSTGHWSIILVTPALVGIFAYWASGGDMRWVLRSCILGLIAGAAWYLTY